MPKTSRYWVVWKSKMGKKTTRTSRPSRKSAEALKKFLKRTGVKRVTIKKR